MVGSITALTPTSYLNLLKSFISSLVGQVCERKGRTHDWAQAGRVVLNRAAAAVGSETPLGSAKSVLFTTRRAGAGASATTRSKICVSSSVHPACKVHLCPCKITSLLRRRSHGLKLTWGGDTSQSARLSGRVNVVTPIGEPGDSCWTGRASRRTVASTTKRITSAAAAASSERLMPMHSTCGGATKRDTNVTQT
eukprot:728800-Prorocentrum_minimum.AAC.2